MKPLSKAWMDDNGNVDYDAYIHSHDWDVKRAERLELDNHECQVCGTSERPLQVHHRSYANLGNEQMDDLITVCSTCHAIISEIEHTNLSDKVNMGLLHLNILTNKYQHARRAVMECAVSKAIVRHIKEIPEADGNYTTKIEPWIANILEAVRDSRQGEINASGATSAGIAYLITNGTFRKGRTYEQNVNSFTRRTKDFVDALPIIPTPFTDDNTD